MTTNNRMSSLALIATVVGMMLLSALSSFAPSQRSSSLFDRQLLFKEEFQEWWESSETETCAGGDECKAQCDANASCDTDVCQGACDSLDNARDCGCTTTAKCWNEDCKAQCMGGANCLSEECQDTCQGDQEACGCTEPQQRCWKNLCEDACTEDPGCEKDSSCARTCVSPPQALGCGCGVKGECFNNDCRLQCGVDPKRDPNCETQACQDACVTEDNTVACCGCIKPACEAMCGQDIHCLTSECQEACGSPAMQEACFCTKEPTNQSTTEPTDEPPNQPTTNQPTNQPTTEPTNQPTTELTKEPTNEPTTEPTNEPTNQPTTEPTKEPTNEPTTEPFDPDVPQPFINEVIAMPIA
jgi:hypothetical protein